MKPLRIAIFSFLLGATCLAQDVNKSGAGAEVALAYIQAFFHGNLKAVADYLPASSLVAAKKLVVDQVGGNKNAAEQGQILNALGFPSLEALQKGDPKEIFIKINIISRASTPEFTEMAKKATVVVEKTEILDANRQKITLIVHIDGKGEQRPTVTVEKQGASWVIVGT